MRRILRRAAVAPLGAVAALAAGAALVLSGCAGPRSQEPPTATAQPPAPATAPAPGRADAARWHAADWSELAGWRDDRVAEAWPALLAGCARPAPAWRETCARAQLQGPGDDESLRRWFEQHLQPWRIESAAGGATGQLTGYFEPTLVAARQPHGPYRVPLHAPPPGLAQRKPYYTREQLETLPAAVAALRGRELAYVEDPLDALLLQVQGSGRLQLVEPDGRRRWVRLAFAAHNDHPFRSPGRWLTEEGELAPGAASWPAIKAWARMNPERVRELLWVNPRQIFFREEPLTDPDTGPRGALGVPLTPGRSVAVDPQAVPLGSPLWIDSSAPPAGAPLRRLVLAQDTGQAITGAVRADYFWGWDAEAELQAGRTRQPLRWWVLWPRGVAPPAAAGSD